jgi:hypothetical protein
VYIYKKNTKAATRNNLVEVILREYIMFRSSSFEKHGNVNGRKDYQENNRAL